MKAIIFDQAGRADETLAVREIAPPKPSRGEVLIEVAARPIHPADFCSSKDVTG